MLIIISTLVVLLCLSVIIFCFFAALKSAEIAEQELQNEAAAHRILMKLANVYSMSDEHDGLAKAKALRELRVEVIQYSESVKVSPHNSDEPHSEDVVSFAIGKIRLLS